jgi:dihydroflavonol-4-reductase
VPLVVVTGASGLVGADLVRALVREGVRVRVLVRADTRAVDGLPVELVHGDLRDAAAVDAALAGADTVHHPAGPISVGQLPPDHVHAVNVGGTRNVVRACLRQGVGRLVYCSSVHALDHRPDEVPVDELRPLWTVPGQCSAYDLSRADAAGAVAWLGGRRYTAV